MRAEEPEISVYLWLSVNMFIEWVENFSLFSMMVRRMGQESFQSIVFFGQISADFFRF